MGLKDFLKNTIWRCDLLSQPAALRARQQPTYETLTGGVISILLMGLFYYFLYLQLFDMLNKLTITYSSGVGDNVDSTSAITSFPFAVSIEGVDLSVTPRKFIISLTQNRIVGGTPTSSAVLLSPCNASDWSGYGTDFEAQFNAFGFGQMLCIQSGQSISLAGYAGSSTFEYLSLQIHTCNQTLDASCDTTANINSYVTSHVSTNDYFKVKFFALDTILTPDKDKAITYVLEKSIFLAFSNTMGTVGLLNLAQYSLQTDTSLFPVENFNTVTGNYIQNYATNAVSLSTTRYIDFNIYRSTKGLTVSRTIGKIDSILSYVGGLFSLLFTAVAFFFGSYSTYKYELSIAESTLTNDKGKNYKADDFGFFTFVAYCCYDWMDSFGIAPESLKKLKNIHDIRSESCDQLEPSIILRRIKHLEDVSKVLISQHKEMCLYLSKPLSLEEAKKMRNTLQFYNGMLEEMNGEGIQDSNTESGDHFLGRNNQIENESDLNILSKRSEEKEVSEEDEKKTMIKNMAAFVEQIENEQSELAQKIRDRIPSKIKEYIKAPILEAQLATSGGDRVKPRNSVQLQIVNLDATSPGNKDLSQAKGFPKDSI